MCVPVFMVSRWKYRTVFVIYWAVNASLQLSMGCPNGPCWSCLTRLAGMLTDLCDSCIISAHTQTLIPFCFSPLPDSDPAPLPKCCEGHPAGRPVSGEFLLTGCGASQQARGGGQVGLSCIQPGVRICCLPPPFFLPSPLLHLLIFFFYCPQAVCIIHACLASLDLCKHALKKCWRQVEKELHKHGQGRWIWPAGDLLQPVCRCLHITTWELRVLVQS